MRTRSQGYCTFCRRSGLTLTEVVAAVFILSTLLVGMLVAHRRDTRQMQTARQRLVAIRAADRLLAQWFETPRAFPVVHSGAVPGEPELVWGTEAMTSPNLEQLGVQKVRLVIRSRGSQTKERDPALLTVEIVVATAEPPKTDEVH